MPFIAGMERNGGGEKSQLQDIIELMGSCFSCKNKTKSLSKKNYNQRERDDLCTPSSVLFDLFCQDVVSRFEVDHLVCSASVTGIDVVNSMNGGERDQIFTITYYDGVGEPNEK
jgi:hypothetical protein